MSPISVRLCRARQDDADWLLELRNAPDVRAVSGDQAPIAEATHAAWFRRALADPGTKIYMLKGQHEQRLGYLRLELRGPIWWVSIAIDPGYRRQGIAAAALCRAAEQLPYRRFRAWIQADNVGSRRTFERAGYHLLEPQAALLCYERASA